MAKIHEPKQTWCTSVRNYSPASYINLLHKKNTKQKRYHRKTCSVPSAEKTTLTIKSVHFVDEHFLTEPATQKHGTAPHLS